MPESNTLRCERVVPTAKPELATTLERAVTKFTGMEPLSISSHGDRCCQLAQEWFRAQSRAHHEISGLPAPWLRRRWNWGPCERPAHWCEVMNRTNIDCNQLAALSVESMAAVNEPAVVAQIIGFYDDSSVENWVHYWRNNGGDYWVSDHSCYHEAMAVGSPGSSDIRIWDPTAESFSEERPLAGFGSIAALRICDDGGSPLCHDGFFHWRGHFLPAGKWTTVAQMD